MNRATPAVLLCFLFGNFVIGLGVLMVPGSLNDISHDLQISVAQAGFLITAGSVLMCLSAPVFATVLGKRDRRQLLGWVMLWYGLAHALCVLMPSFQYILWMRVLAMVAPAIFTPQAAACIGQLSQPSKSRASHHVHLHRLVCRLCRWYANSRLGWGSLWLAGCVWLAVVPGFDQRHVGLARDTQGFVTARHVFVGMASNVWLHALDDDRGCHGLERIRTVRFDRLLRPLFQTNPGNQPRRTECPFCLLWCMWPARSLFQRGVSLKGEA